MRPFVTALVFALLVPTMAPPPALAAKPTAEEQKARALYDDAVQRYDLAEYDRAIDEFKQVYLLTNRPELLFNLAQSHRAKHDYDTALHFYRTYLKFKPDAPNRLEVRAYIGELEKALHERDIVRPALEKPPEKPPEIQAEKPPEKPAPGPTEARKDPPTATVVVPVQPQPAFFKTRRGHAVIALVAMSAGSLISAAATGGVVVARRDAYDQGCNLGACNGSLYTQGHALAIATDVLIGLGAATALTAVIVAVTRPKAARARDLAALRVRF